MLFDLKNDMEEIWKTVKGYNGYYQVSNTGKVRNPNKVLTPNVGVKNGYVYVTLRKDKRLLHRIVAETFIPNPFNKPEVDHINGIRTDNNVCNLRWVTRTENNNNPRRCVKMRTFFFYAQSPDFHKQGLCYYLKILYL